MEVKVIEILGKIEILVAKKNNKGFIVTYKKQKIGTLEGWFSYKTYQYNLEEIFNLGINDVCNIINGIHGGGCMTEKALKPSDAPKYKTVLVTVSTDSVSISPYEKCDQYGGAIAKYTVDISINDDSRSFAENIKKAIEDAG
jgi:hypothetical protein